jgi:S1-C subfamily serine protease
MAWTFPPEVLESVVSVLPLWPGHARGGRGEVPPGAAPEGTAVAIRPGGYLVTALHVVDQAEDIVLRIADGREVPAELVARDPATDLALLKAGVALPLLAAAPEPALGTPVCAVGNQFGLDLSVTCGVVSALHRSGTGFNTVEDFVQTDATVNPGASGGALVDAEGRLVGVLSAIFTKESDNDVGVNFAASIALVERVVDDLVAHGRVVRARPGLRVAALEPAARAESAGVRVASVASGGAAARAGIKAGDVITGVDGHAIRKPSDVTAAFALRRRGERVAVTVVRAGTAETLALDLPR